jgi:cation transport ATPase
MITQELIDFVKTQLSAGVTREKITSDLLGEGGWTIEQINEAFQKANLPQQTTDPSLSDETSAKTDVWERIRKYNNRSLIVALVIFFIAVVLATGGRFVTGFVDLLGDNWIGAFVWMMLGVLALFSFFFGLKTNTCQRNTLIHTLNQI